MSQATSQAHEVPATAPADASRRRLAGRLGVVEAGPQRALLALVTLGVVAAGSVGGDARWLGALGRVIVRSGHVPVGVPFAEAPTADWHNVPVLAELALSAVMALGGDRGLVLAQAAAVAGAMLVLGRDARRAGASERSTALVLLLVALGSLTTLLLARLQMFSLVLLPLELSLLRSQARRPTRLVWLLVPLLALWSNLHGAALLGLALAGCYLLLGRARLRPAQSVLVGAACGLALCITPALASTPAYYLGVLQNETARRHLGLWARLSPASPFDVALVVVAVVLLPALLRARRPLWEVVALLALAVLTAQTARNGVWLLVAAAPPAAAGWQRGGRRHGRHALPVTALLWTAVGALCVLVMALGPFTGARTSPVVDLAVHAAGGRPVVAEGALSEQVVQRGGRVWLTNPLDAFSHDEQRRYVAWVQTGDTRLLPLCCSLVLVRAGGSADAALAAGPQVRLVVRDGTAALYRRS